MESPLPRSFKAPLGSFFLFGPRGTGKTTWLKQHLPRALYIDLLEPATYRSLAARPERLVELIAGAMESGDVIIDEVQRLPSLLPLVHRLIEGPHPPRFILTGSSSRKLRRVGTDLLAGRLLLRTMHPFTAGELGDGFDLDDALTLGMVPVVRDSVEPAETLKAYAALYLEQEVQAEGLTRDIGAFSRFLEAAAFSHAGLLNVSAVARECEVGRKTVEGYFGILEDLLLAFQVAPFTRRARRATVGRSKFFYFDAGVYRSLRPAGPLDRPGEIAGCALEGLVAQHLRAAAAYGSGGSDLYHWRTRGGNEVDLVRYGSNVFEAIEIKHAARVRPEDTRGLRAFGAEYPEARLVVLYRGSERLRLNRIEVIPVDEYLRKIDTPCRAP